jgi:hypothetical protein
VSAISFYSPVTPRAVVDLGMSLAAAQSLSEPGPAGTGTALDFDQLEGEARSAMAARADSDWTRFLERRAAELAPDGVLVVDTMGIDDAGVAAFARDVAGFVRAFSEPSLRQGLALGRDAVTSSTGGSRSC